jgi:hypothetical protein
VEAFSGRVCCFFPAAVLHARTWSPPVLPNPNTSHLTIHLTSPLCSWTPPNWVFPAVWIPLKVLQSIALWLVVKQAPDRKALALPLALFGTHLFLGNYWNGEL